MVGYAFTLPLVGRVGPKVRGEGVKTRAASIPTPSLRCHPLRKRRAIAYGCSRPFIPSPSRLRLDASPPLNGAEEGLGSSAVFPPPCSVWERCLPLAYRGGGGAGRFATYDCSTHEGEDKAPFCRSLS
jgi:hypothetical protein